MHAVLLALALVCVVIAGLFFDVALQAADFGVTFQLTMGLLVAFIVTMAILVFLASMVYRASFLKVKTGTEALVGAKGVAITDLKPKGTVRVMSEFWQAIAKDHEIASGAEVDVVGIDGLFLVVKRHLEKA
jgi:membrane-bound serine protease (ClpP class)